jgi:hypothetical protein
MLVILFIIKLINFKKMSKLKKISFLIIVFSLVFLFNTNKTEASNGPDLGVIGIGVLDGRISDSGQNEISVRIKNFGDQASGTLTSLNLIYGTNFSEIENCQINSCFGVGNKYNASINIGFLGKQSLAPGEEYTITFNRQNYLLDTMMFDEGIEYLFKVIINTDNNFVDNNLSNNTNSVKGIPTHFPQGQNETELPDLTVTDIKFTSSTMNEVGVLSVTIKNLGGDLDSASGLMNWYNNFSSQNFIFTNTSNPTISSFNTNRSIPTSSSPLEKNESIAFSWHGKFNTHGNIYLHFTVNNNRELEESNYNNNTLTTSIKINKPTIVDQITSINQSSQNLAQGNINELLFQINQLRSQVREQEAQIKYLQNLTTELSRVSATMQTAINTFVTYGVDDNTKRLGEGERAAVINSYQSAYGKLPNSETELNDVIKIANGRWPSATNVNAENRAKAEFKNIYKREANMNNANDNAAVTIMAYGLRQRAENRNLNSESAGLKIFRGIYNRIPQSTNDWNILQAITYSGATR